MKKIILLLIVFTNTISLSMAQHNAYLDIEGIDTANVCLKTSSISNPTILELATGDTSSVHTHFYIRNQSDALRVDVRSDLLSGGSQNLDGKRNENDIQKEKNLYDPHTTDIMRLDYLGNMRITGNIQLNDDPSSPSLEGSIRYNQINGYGRIEGYVNGSWKSICPSCPNAHINSPNANQTFSQEYQINSSNQVVITVEFSAPIDPNTVVYGSSISLLSTPSGTLIPGTLSWNSNHTQLTFTSTNDFGSFCNFSPNCIFTLNMTDSIISKQGCAIDGNGNGEEGGDFTTSFGILG